MPVLSRDSKIVPIDEVVSWVSDGMLLGIGGVSHENKPMALERALIRRGVKNLRLTALSGAGYDADLLIAAGAVAQTYVPAITFGSVGMAPTFRASVEGGSVVAHAVDATTVMGGYVASAEGLPFHPVVTIRGSDVTKRNPLLRPMKSPLDGSDLWAIVAVAPDVAFIHVQEADMFGNARCLGATAHGEVLLARAAKRVVLSCDHLVEPEAIMADPMRTTILSMYVDAVVCLPYGAHPTASPFQYRADRDHIRDYWTIAERARTTQDRAGLQEYLDRFVYAPQTHEAYLERIGRSRLTELVGPARSSRKESAE